MKTNDQLRFHREVVVMMLFSCIDEDPDTRSYRGLDATGPELRAYYARECLRLEYDCHPDGPGHLDYYNIQRALVKMHSEQS